MEKALERIFRSVQSDLQKNLKADEKRTLADSSKPLTLQKSGSIPFSFHLDGGGNSHYEAEQYGAGVTVHISAWIDDPDAVYTITVRSTDGGGGHWENVHPKEKQKCDIHTSFWHKTKISVDLHANVINKDGHGTIEYSY